MAYTGIDSYAKPHGSGKNNTGTRIQVLKTSNTYDPNYMNINTLDSHNINVDNLRVTSETVDNAYVKYIMSPNGIINKINGSELNYSLGRIDDLSSSNIGTNKLNVNDEATIKNIINEYLKTNEINTDYLTVNKSAHFFELLVDKIRSVQGTQINTAANCIVDYVEAYDNNNQLMDVKADTFNEADVKYYRIYWKNTDDDGRSIDNTWLENDQAICWTFNIKGDQSQQANNKYYWRLVNKIDNGLVKYINFNTGEVTENKPDTFKIIFTNGFKYGDVNDPDNIYTNFNVTSNNENNPNDYDKATSTWTPSSTLYGIQVVVNQNENVVLAGGGLLFDTNIPTKLNIGVYYDDGTFDYFQGQEYTTSYNIVTAENKNAEAFIICTNDLDKWESCNWIELSNVTADINKEGTRSIPEIGDNICQLGYRYTMLPDYEETDEWKNNHKKDIARASAIIIAAYDTPDQNVFPPSYAQYQDITSFVLGDWTDGGITYSNRGTYFDATGAYIKGKLVAGTTVDTGINLPISIDDWSIKSDTSVLTKDTNDVINPPFITLSLLHNNGSTSEIIDTLPSNKRIYINGVDSFSYAPTEPLKISTSYYGFNKYNIELKSYGGTPQTFDKLIIDTFDINATNGQNGSYIQFIYKNGTTEPERPIEDAFPPEGWTTSATTPLEGEYTWMAQRTISFTTANDPIHNDWTSPVRISGNDGELGIDGDGVEFIYHRTKENKMPSLWQTYTDVTNPSLLSDNIIQYTIKYGEEGYNTSANLIKAWKEGLTTHSTEEGNYIPPSSQSETVLHTGWKSEPQGVNETYIYEWVSVRTYNGAEKKWNKFSSPVIWAKYGENGVNGVDGINGIDGKNGEGWFLTPIVHEFNVDIKSASDYDDIVGVVKTNFKFAIQHIDGDTNEWVSAEELANYSLNLITDNTYGRNICRSTDTQNTSQVKFEITSVSVDGISIPVISVTSPNYLRYTSNVQDDLNPFGNYYNLHKHIGDSNPSYKNAMFSYITIQLVRTGISIMDTYSQDLIFNPNHIFTASDNALNSVYQGLSGDVDELTGSYATGFSNIRQAWDNINLNVNNLTSTNRLPQSNNLTQYAWYKKGNVEAPIKPSGTIQVDSNVADQWTSYQYPYPDSSYQYMFVSQRTRTQTAYSYYGAWGAWSEPIIIYTYTGGLATYANSATLDIKADQIQSTVSKTYLSKDDAKKTYTTMTQVTQTATSISAQVKSEIEGSLKETGIDIENGKIILQADATEITGDTLTLNQNQGILVTDGDTFNNISIKASDIESFGRDVVYNLTFDTNKYGKQIHHYDRGTSSYTWSWADEQYFEIGYLYPNSVVKENNIKGIYTELYYKNNTEVRYKTLAADPVITLYLKDGNTYTPVYNQWDYNGSFTIQTAGEYFIGIGDVTYTYESQNINGDDTYARVIAKFDVTAKGNNNIEIGTNGYNVVINNTTKAGSVDVNYDFINYMNKDEWVVEDVTNTNNNHSTLLRNRTGLKITNHNVPLQKGCYQYQEQKYDTWSTVGTIMNIRSISDNVVNVNAAYDYYLLTGGTSAKTFNMTPSANTCLPIGKIIYIKNISSYTVNCNAGSSQYPLLINLNKNSAVQNISLSAGQQASFIWTGQYFIRIS